MFVISDKMTNKLRGVAGMVTPLLYNLAGQILIFQYAIIYKLASESNAVYIHNNAIVLAVIA